jgi:CoA-transferase family III
LTDSGDGTNQRWRRERTEWAGSGMLWLTGHPGSPPLWPVAGLMEGLGDTSHRIADRSARLGRRIRPEPDRLLTGRAALLGLSRRGPVSPGGASRLLSAADGWVALTFSRPDDLALVPAILGTVTADDPWSALTSRVRSLGCRHLVDRARLVGVPAAAIGDPGELAASGDPEIIEHLQGAVPGRSLSQTLVVDLSSLWAGPLCAKLLGEAGCRVVKVESTDRPDGARAGNARFFDWLHSGHESVVLDFGSGQGLEVLHALVARADVVIEASRPRALAALGIEAEGVVGRARGKTWLSITGYGREGKAADRVAFGDDAGVAAGLVAWDPTGHPVFCGDAVADPVAGMVAARAVLDSRARGGGELIDLSMVGALRSVARSMPPGATPVPDRMCDTEGSHTERSDTDDWTVEIDGSMVPVERPAPPASVVPAAPLGAHTTSVIAELVTPTSPDG